MKYCEPHASWGRAGNLVPITGRSSESFGTAKETSDGADLEAGKLETLAGIWDNLVGDDPKDEGFNFLEGLLDSLDETFSF